MSTTTVDLRHYIAIDPGKKGGIVATTARDLELHNMPATLRDAQTLLQAIVLRQAADGIRTVAYIEELPKFVRAIPSSAVFVMARNYGQMEGILAGLDIPIVHVKPQAWQKALGLGTSKGGSKTAWKNKLKERAQNLFPGRTITLQTSDAALILHAAQHRLI